MQFLTEFFRRKMQSIELHGAFSLEKPHWNSSLQTVTHQHVCDNSLVYIFMIIFIDGACMTFTLWWHWAIIVRLGAYANVCQYERHFCWPLKKNVNDSLSDSMLWLFIFLVFMSSDEENIFRLFDAVAYARARTRLRIQSPFRNAYTEIAKC